MGRIVFRLALGGLALYFYSQGNVFWAVLCLVVIAWSFLQQQLARIAGVLGRLTSLPQEHDANSVLIYTFRVNLVFEDSAVDDLFARLLKNIKNNLLFVNGEPDFGDHVYHELEIPYRWTEAVEPQEVHTMTSDIETQLSVRMLLLNGMLSCKSDGSVRNTRPTPSMAAA